MNGDREAREDEQAAPEQVLHRGLLTLMAASKGNSQQVMLMLQV